jgi:hypothetical protein
MGKRKSTKAKPTKRAAKPKAAKPKPSSSQGTSQSPEQEWHVCTSCLDPLAKELSEVTERLMFRSVMKSSPTPGTFQFLYSKHGVEFTIDWLKLHESVDFANDFEDKLFNPLRRFEKLYWRAYRTAEKTLLPKNELTCENMTTLVADRLRDGEFYRDTFPNEVLPAFHPNISPFEEPGVDLDPCFDVGMGFLHCEAYLRRISVILRAKLEKRGIPEHTIPPLVMTELMTKSLIAEIFICHRNQVDHLVLDRYYHERVGRKIRMRVEDMPRNYIDVIDSYKKRRKSQK